MTTGSTPIEPSVFVIFGALGDLSKRKLLPALAKLRAKGHSGDQGLILGVGRRPQVNDAGFRATVRDALAEAGGPDSEERALPEDSIYYHAMPRGDHDDYMGLAARLESLERQHGLGANRVFYLSLPPSQFAPVIGGLGEGGLAGSSGWTRLVIEKPFGRDLESAQALNQVVHGHFDESQVYRIDHYLGKETVQNLLVFRLANAIFESLWNREHVESVQILVSEELGVEDRAGYYDKSGALRDMVQNHLTQLLTLVAMEVPTAVDAESIRFEKIKVLRSLSPIRRQDVTFGQYVDGTIEGRRVPGYLEEPGVAAASETETFVSLKLQIDNWRWQGVPFSIRTGKRLPRRLTQIAVTFRRPPVCLFDSMGSCPLHSNVLLMTLQPDEGFNLYFDVKVPGEPFDLKTLPLSFRYGDTFDKIPDAYETLLLDILQGDQTLFVHSDEVETSWSFYEPLLRAKREIHPYAAGTWGPEAAARQYFVGAPEWLDIST